MAYNTKALLTDVNGKPIPQYYDVATDSFLPMSNAVELSGRNVAEAIVHDAVEIRNTLASYDITVNASTLSGRKYVHVNNGLNQSVTITIFALASGGSAVSIATKVINAATKDVISPADFPKMQDPIPSMIVRAQCGVSPASGTISTWLMGVQA